MKTKSAISAQLKAVMLMLSLTGCATVSPAPTASSQIYQPRVLILQAGNPIQTKEGTYVPQRDEVWHSAAAFETVESQLINAVAALAQERNRK